MAATRNQYLIFPSEGDLRREWEKINEKGMKTIMEIFFVQHRNMSVKRVQPVSDRMSHNAQQSLV
jgi:hypothetical protein